MNSFLAKLKALRQPRFLFAGLLISVGISLTLVLVPAWIIQPFKPQTQSGVELSYLFRQWSPTVTVVLAVVGFLMVLGILRTVRRPLVRALAMVILVAGLGAAALARWNYFEAMFNPLPNPAFAAIGETDFVADSDMVLAVEKGGDRAAYPVRQMAYHHIVQDVVGGTPLVVTY